MDKIKIYLFLFLYLFFYSIFSSEYYDTTFGSRNTGYETTQINFNAQINCIALGSEEKIIVGGCTKNDTSKFFTLARYTNTGDIDVSFGNNGIVTTQVATLSIINSIAIHNNKIIAAGNAVDSITKIAIARYNSDGSLDTNFGSNGIVLTNVNDAASANSVKILNDGSILVGGTTILNGQSLFVLVKYDSSGNIDTNFGNNGVVTKTINYHSSISDIVIQSDHKIVVGGSNFNGSINQLILARFNSDGSDDLTFGFNGITITAIGDASVINKISLDNNEKIIIVGQAGQYPNEQFLMAQYTTSGALDTTFNTTGYVLTTIEGSDSAKDVKVQPDDKIVVGGITNTNGITKFALARYNTDGAMDSTFGNSGNLTQLIDDSSGINSIAIQTDGNILAAGFSQVTAENITKFAVARFVKSNVNSISITAPENNSSQYRKYVSFAGSSTGNNSTVKVYLDSVLFATVSTDGSGDWSTSLTTLLSEGAHNVKAELLDGSNNVLATDVNNFVIDTSVVSSSAYGNILRVDKIFGNDSNGVRNGPPFMTINAALAKAQAGDIVEIFPGSYDEAITIPTDVHIRGTMLESCIIRKLNVTQDTDLVTLGEYATLENLTLQLTSTGHHQLRGVVYPGTTTKTTNCRIFLLTVDNSTASSGGSSNVYGIYSAGSGKPVATDLPTIRSARISVRSIGSGTKRGIMLDSNNNLLARDVNLVCMSLGGAGTYYGMETNHASAVLSASTSLIFGSTSDISQTLGTINLNTTALANTTANSLGFTNTSYPSLLVWGHDSNFVLGGTFYIKPGNGTANSTETKLIAPQNMIIKSLSINAVTAPGGGNTDTFTLRKNAVDTGLTLTLSGTATNNINDSVSVRFVKGDTISLKLVTGLTTGLANFVLTMTVY